MRGAYAVRAAAVACLLAGCGAKEAESPRPGGAAAPRAGVYSGTFPCADCAGIVMTLWLRADGSFFSRRSYMAGDAPRLDAYNSGLWRAERGGGRVVLDGAGPDQVLTRADAHRLELETHSPIAHVLFEADEGHAFADRFPLEAVVERRGGAYVATHCPTGLVAPLGGGADLPAFRRQFGSVGSRGAAVYAEFEGRFVWDAGGAPRAVEVERLLGVEPGRGC